MNTGAWPELSAGFCLLLQAIFGLVAGPLTWSIVALRNSLVLHSLDQVRTHPWLTL